MMLRSGPGLSEKAPLPRSHVTELNARVGIPLPDRDARPLSGVRASQCASRRVWMPSDGG